jgi:hypothetical protein
MCELINANHLFHRGNQALLVVEEKQGRLAHKVPRVNVDLRVKAEPQVNLVLLGPLVQLDLVVLEVQGESQAQEVGLEHEVNQDKMELQGGLVQQVLMGNLDHLENQEDLAHLVRLVPEGRLDQGENQALQELMDNQELQACRL